MPKLVERAEFKLEEGLGILMTSEQLDVATPTARNKVKTEAFTPLAFALLNSTDVPPRDFPTPHRISQTPLRK